MIWLLVNTSSNIILLTLSQKSECGAYFFLNIQVEGNPEFHNILYPFKIEWLVHMIYSLSRISDTMLNT